MRPFVRVGAWSVCVYVCWSCAKTAEQVVMPFVMWTWVGLRNHVLRGRQVEVSPGKRQFGGITQPIVQPRVSPGKSWFGGMTQSIMQPRDIVPCVLSSARCNSISCCIVSYSEVHVWGISDVPKLFVIRQQRCGLSLLVLRQLVIHYFVPERCEVLRLSYLSVGLSVCSLEYFKRTARTNSTKFSVGLHVACCRSSVFSRRRNTLCTSGFADDVRYIPER